MQQDFPRTPPPTVVTVNAPTAGPTVVSLGETAVAPLTQAQPQAPAHRAGVGILMALAGGALGWWVGGWRGAGAGVLAVGAARNGVSTLASIKAGDPERAAATSTLAVIGASGAGWLGYQVYQQRTESPAKSAAHTSEEEEESDE